MKALRLVWSLIRIPRLFISLLLFPLFLSLVVVYIQLLVTGVVLSSTKIKTAEQVKAGLAARRESSFARRFLLKTNEPLTSINVCRWTGSADKEQPPPGKECELSPYDVAIFTSNPEKYDSSEYEKIFLGNFRRIHICHKKCRTDVVLAFNDDGTPEVHFFSVLGAALFEYVSISDLQVEYRVKAVEERDHLRALIGKQFLHSAGLLRPVPLDDLRESFMMIINIASIVVISLWLALKAHRKVLDYFASSGALLPMVAATGKTSFYGAIWILTLLRVFAFLVASIPLCWATLSAFSEKDVSDLFFRGDRVAFVLWLVAVGVSIALATLIASIAELKHRHSVMSFIYRYFPLLLCFVGMGYWGLTFLIQTSTFSLLRDIISALPLVGMGPIILAPIFSPQYAVLIVNTVLTLILLIISVRSNVRWFAAHLEDI
jgi:hypothetical protein